MRQEGRVTDAVPQIKVGDIRQEISRFVPSGGFEVIKQLPGSGEPEYRIKSANELHERATRESELIRAPA